MEAEEMSKSGHTAFRIFRRWTRKLHVYFGLFISPFILVFAVSAIIFNHTWSSADSKSNIQKEEVPVEINEDMEGLEIAKDIMRQVGISGEIEFFAHQPQRKQMRIPVMKPGKRITINVDADKKIAVVERKRTGFLSALLYLHKSPGPHLAGFRGNWFYTKLWGWLADITVYLILSISISGIYIWSLSKSERKMGLILLGAGVLTLILILFAIAG